MLFLFPLECGCLGFIIWHLGKEKCYLWFCFHQSRYQEMSSERINAQKRMYDGYAMASIPKITNIFVKKIIAKECAKLRAYIPLTVFDFLHRAALTIPQSALFEREGCWQNGGSPAPGPRGAY